MNTQTSEYRAQRSVRVIRAGLIALCVALGILLFGFMGNTHEPTTYGPSIISWLARQWMTPGGNSGHGWFILPVALAVAWQKRKQLTAAPRHTDYRALAAIAFCLFLYWAGYRTQQPRLGVLCLIGLSWAVPLLLLGNSVARLLLFPCSYLIFALPMGFLTALSFPLRLFSCSVAANLLNGIGIATARSGTRIISTAAKGFALNVDDPCSGLNSLIAMTALTAVYAYWTQKCLLKKWILFLSAVPLAMAGNVIRIMTISLVAVSLGTDAAMKLYHDYSGYIVFVSAILFMMGLGKLLDRNIRQDLKKWMSKSSNRT